MAIDIKRARRDLNPRPTEPESVALSTEPRALSLLHYSTNVIPLTFVFKDNRLDLRANHDDVLQSGGVAQWINPWNQQRRSLVLVARIVLR